MEISRKDQIELLKLEINEGLNNISEKYRKSILNRELDNRILVKTKNFLENLHTVLDFVAKDILEKFCTREVRNYFPIIKKEASDQVIQNAIRGGFPGLEDNNLDLYNYLISIQPKQNINNEWLLRFNSLCGSNKHELLTPHIRQDHILNILVSNDRKNFFLWSDGLVKFTPGNSAHMTLSYGGIISRQTEIDSEIENGYLKTFGWIVEKLENHIIADGPELSEDELKNNTIESYIIGNFYFPDEVQNIHNQLNDFKEKIFKLVDGVYTNFE